MGVSLTNGSKPDITVLKNVPVPMSQLPPLYKQADWVGLKSGHGGARTPMEQDHQGSPFYLTSLESDAQKLGRAIRQHWGIENKLHWTIDVTFAEDACRIRTGHAPQNLSLLRRIALNALNREKSRRSTRQKSNRAAMENNYMLKVLSACLPATDDYSEPVCQ